MTFDCVLQALGLDWEPSKTWVEFDTPEIEPYEYANDLPDDVYSYLKSRGDEYGISVQELLDKVPDVLKNDPALVHAYVKSKHISHIIPLSVGGSPDSPDNWMFEDEDTNVARGATEITDTEQTSIAADNALDAHVLMDLVATKVLTLDTLLEHQDYVEDVFNSTAFNFTPAQIAKAGLKTVIGIV